jgi:hypothetical protein
MWDKRTYTLYGNKYIKLLPKGVRADGGESVRELPLDIREVLLAINASKIPPGICLLCWRKIRMDGAGMAANVDAVFGSSEGDLSLCRECETAIKEWPVFVEEPVEKIFARNQWAWKVYGEDLITNGI